MPGEPVVAALGLGANLGDPRAALAGAVDAIARLEGVRTLRVSSAFRTDPVGGPQQPRFVNGAVAVATELEPEVLLDALQAIEAAAGRVRDVRFGPRTLDIDLLLYGTQEIRTRRLEVPHPRLLQRRFALEPLVEVLPDATLPDGRPLAPLLAALPAAGVERVAGSLSSTL